MKYNNIIISIVVIVVLLICMTNYMCNKNNENTENQDVVQTMTQKLKEQIKDMGTMVQPVPDVDA
jgi:hypothetical protein